MEMLKSQTRLNVDTWALAQNVQGFELGQLGVTALPTELQKSYNGSGLWSFLPHRHSIHWAFGISSWKPSLFSFSDRTRFPHFFKIKGGIAVALMFKRCLRTGTKIHRHYPLSSQKTPGLSELSVPSEIKALMWLQCVRRPDWLRKAESTH